ncbi:MAG: DUF1028 domain-containing protein [Pleurocapsa sp. SU_196_0]|nr:DUF1028 domain-containing protein [Pleurocapsa sp. SU_196_0]
MYQSRQYGMVDAAGAAFSFTGSECHAWAGGRTGDGYAVQGNLLAGEGVVEALASVYEARDDLPLPERLLTALLAGDRAGGDARGRQGAALYVARVDGGYAGFNDRYVDLRVDDHADPIVELQRLLGMHRLLFEHPNAEALLELTGDTKLRLEAVLIRAGVLARTSETWGDAAQEALESLMGVENLEERLVKAGWVDPLVLEFLERKFGAA